MTFLNLNITLNNQENNVTRINDAKNSNNNIQDNNTSSSSSVRQTTTTNQIAS